LTIPLFDVCDGQGGQYAETAGIDLSLSARPVPLIA
jgi:hypothetical protein